MALDSPAILKCDTLLKNYPQKIQSGNQKFPKYIKLVHLEFLVLFIIQLYDHESIVNIWYFIKFDFSHLICLSAAHTPSSPDCDFDLLQEIWTSLQSDITKRVCIICVDYLLLAKIV